MKYNFDTRADALYISFSDNPYLESKEVEEDVILDYDKDNRIIKIEILNASKRLASDFTVYTYTTSPISPSLNNLNAILTYSSPETMPPLTFPAEDVVNDLVINNQEIAIS